jgi:hypothetical protein
MSPPCPSEDSPRTTSDMSEERGGSFAVAAIGASLFQRTARRSSGRNALNPEPRSALLGAMFSAWLHTNRCLSPSLGLRNLESKRCVYHGTLRP